MEWKSAVGLVIALFAVVFLAMLLAPAWHRIKGFQTTSTVHPREINRLCAEEINRRTLRLAATIKPSTK
jgi:hypothetical protein